MQRLLYTSGTYSQSRHAIASNHTYSSIGKAFSKCAIRQALSRVVLPAVKSRLLVSSKYHFQLYGFSAGSSAAASVDHENPAINNKIRAGKALQNTSKKPRVNYGVYYFFFIDSSKPVIVLFDAHALIFRAFHAIPPMNRKDGTPTNAVFGFMR